MALSYEDALATLESMFSDSKWSRETLDAVLRHQKGHMENTVDFILRHSGKDPETLAEQLKAGINPDESSMDTDAALARQLAQGNSGAATTTSSTARGRGTMTTLPDDFLRIPGYNPSDFVTPESDEAYARRLQQEEEAMQPRRRPRAQQPQQPAARPQRSATPGPNVQLQNVQKSLNEFGENVSSQFRMLASRFNKNAAPPPEPAPAAERRGLLDEEEELEFARR